MFDGRWERCEEEDEDARKIDQGKIEDGIVFSKILVGNDSAQDRSHVAPKLEEIC